MKKNNNLIKTQSKLNLRHKINNTVNFGKSEQLHYVA